MDGDAQLAARLAAGCPAAMESLIGLQGDRLRRTIGQLTAWSPDVDDLLQETLVRAWRNAKSYRGEGPLDKWLVSIAFRVCRDHQRGISRVWERLNKFWLAKKSSNRSNATTQQATETDGWDRIQQAMTQMSPQDRQLLVMKFLEEWSSEELAEHLKLSVETVHVRLHRAKSRLKKLVEQNEQSPS